MADSSAKLWAVVQREYLERVRTKWFAISTILGPVILAIVLFVPILLAKRDSGQVVNRVMVLDVTGTNLGRYVASALTATAERSDKKGDDALHAALPDVQSLTRANLPKAEASATEEVQRRLATGYIVLDSTTLRGDSVRYAGRHTNSGSEMAQVTDAVRNGVVAFRLQQRGVPDAALDSVVTVQPPVLHTEEINDAGRNTSSPAKGLMAAFVAFFLYMCILLYGQSILSGVIEEKMSRVAEIVISSVRPETLLAGKVLGVTAVGITQQLIWILGSLLIVLGSSSFLGATAKASLGASGAGSGMGSTDFLLAVLSTPLLWVAAVLLFFLLGVVFYGSLYAAVGATVGSEQEARQASQPVILLLVLTAVFISPVMTNPTSQLARVMSLLPFSSPILMPLRMAITDVSPLEVGVSILLLAAGCVGATWLAARIYRVGLLMYGKRPSLKELRRWIMAS